MISLVMIARVADGLPLAASIQEDEQVSMEANFFMYPRHWSPFKILSSLAIWSIHLGITVNHLFFGIKSVRMW